MSVQIRVLAVGKEGLWRLVFDSDELHLYIECIRHGVCSAPADWMTIEDFLTRRPSDAHQEQAVRTLVSILRNAMTTAGLKENSPGRPKPKAHRPGEF
ncbi:hypothetical protein [Mesorhizobium sp. B2-6-5]|uniref:hypothetical protein n=1 Tax=Mesorhizobium sp. B2-6-5 TaxID=2589912 RepID=UPI001127AB53|nr:hypothetical protein [Mesorhizobium sp. B2-6-5]TPJ32729.1 hypothetical protein FJ432_32005 [Mesorhizobium sp. B2-6-5]